MAAFARVFASATRGKGSRGAAAALASRVPALGQPVGSSCPRAAAALFVPLGPLGPTARLPPYGQRVLPFGTGVGGIRHEGGGVVPSTVPVDSTTIANDAEISVARARSTLGSLVESTKVASHAEISVAGEDAEVISKPAGLDVEHEIAEDGGDRQEVGLGEGGGERQEVTGGCGSGGGGGCCRCRFDTEVVHRLLKMIHKRNNVEILGAVDKTIFAHIQKFRPELKSMLRRNLGYTLAGFLLEQLLVLLLGICLGVWIMYTVFKATADHLGSQEGQKQIATDFLDPILDHLEERYPRLGVFLGRRKEGKTGWFR